MMSNDINLDQLNNLSPEERALALEILKEISQEGHSEILDDLRYSDFEEIPVDIMTFISEEQYLGRGLYTQAVKNLPAMWETRVRSLAVPPELWRGCLLGI